MDLCSQVVNLELSKRLHELGVPSRMLSIFVWEPRQNHPDEYIIGFSPEIGFGNRRETCYEAYTTSELGEIIADHKFALQLHCRSCMTDTGQQHMLWMSLSNDNKDFEFVTVETSEADCRAKALIYCIEQKLVNIKDINND